MGAHSPRPRGFPPLYAAAPLVLVSKDSRTDTVPGVRTLGIASASVRSGSTPAQSVRGGRRGFPHLAASTELDNDGDSQTTATTTTTARRAYLSKLLRILRIDASKCRTIARIWYKNDLKTITTDCHRLHCHPLPLGGNLPLAGGNLLEKVAIC